jgi:hypothetical protein
MLRAAAVEAHLCSASPPSEARASTAGHLLLQRRPATAAGPPAAVGATTEGASEREERRGKISVAVDNAAPWSVMPRHRPMLSCPIGVSAARRMRPSPASQIRQELGLGRKE